MDWVQPQLMDNLASDIAEPRSHQQNTSYLTTWSTTSHLCDQLVLCTTGGPAIGHPADWHWQNLLPAVLAANKVSRTAHCQLGSSTFSNWYPQTCQRDEGNHPNQSEANNWVLTCSWARNHGRDSQAGFTQAKIKPKPKPYSPYWDGCNHYLNCCKKFRKLNSEQVLKGFQDGKWCQKWGYNHTEDCCALKHPCITCQEMHHSLVWVKSRNQMEGVHSLSSSYNSVSGWFYQIFFFFLK